MRWIHAVWLGFAVGAVVLGFLLDVGNIRSSWQSRSAADIAIAWFTRDEDGSVRLVPLDEVVTEATAQDLYADRLRIPINLAFQGRDSEDLTVDRVEIRYPSGLNVEPSGDPRISADGSTHVYEHGLRALGVDGSFVPLDTIDVVTVPYDFVVTRTVVLTKGDIPFYLLAIAGGFLPGDREPLRLEGTVHFQNRGSVSFVVQMQQERGVEILGLPQYQSGRTPTARDQRLFTAEPLPQEVVSRRWQRRTTEAVNVGFIQSSSRDQGIIQRVSVDGQLVRVLVDRNRDGNLDFELMDADRDGVAELKGLPESPYFMPPWPPSAV